MINSIHSKIRQKNIKPRLILLIVTAIFFAANGFASEISLNVDSMNLFNERLNENDKETLNKGGTLIRSISSMKKLCVKNEGMPSLAIIPMSKRINSGYIAEIINFRPYKGNEDLIERINEAMSNFLSYTEIPYYSEHDKKWQKLYKSAQIMSITTNGETTTIKETLEMDLFGKFGTQIDIENHETYFIYRLMNTDRLKFHGWLPVVASEEMRSVVAVFKTGENWMIYAVGGANTLRIPFMRSRAEQEFTGRVKAFADFVFSAIDKSGKRTESKLDKTDSIENEDEGAYQDKKF